MITASIVTYEHNILDLEAILRSLMNSPVQMVWIIDHSDRSTKLEHELETFKRDEVLFDEYKRRGFNIIYLRHENNGYGGGNNVAMRLAQQMGSQYHLVVNPDVWFRSDVIPALWNYMEMHQDVAQMMPKVLFLDGSIQPLAKMLPTPLDLFGRLVLPACMVRRRNSRYELRQSGYRHTLNVPYLSGCFMFFRMSAMAEIGFFDEGFFMYAEDIDITRRLHRHWKTLFFPSVHIYHKFNRASHRDLRLFWIHAFNLIKYFFKWGWLIDGERLRFNRQLERDINVAISESEHA